MGQAAPPATTNASLTRLKNYAAQPDPGLQQGKAFPTRKLSPQEQVEIAQQEERQGAAHEGQPGQPDMPGTPSLGPNDVPIRNIETHTARIPGFLGSLPKPSSLVVPLLVIVLFWVLIIKVNGRSRWQWLWEVLTGNAVVTESPSTDGTSNPDTQAAQKLATEADQALFQQAINSGQTVTDLRDGTFVPNVFITPSAQIAVTRGV